MSIYPELENLINNGQIIQAVKRYREVYGASLKDSKAAIDMYRHHGRWADQAPVPLEPSEKQVSETVDRALLTQEVRALWADGMKINAIKRYREKTGTGLKESKRLVEAMCADIVIDDGMTPAHSPLQPSEAQASKTEDTALLTQEVRALLGAGLKVKAIKRYREETGAGLKESKRLVEAMCADIGVDGGVASEPAPAVQNTDAALLNASESHISDSLPQVASSEVPVLQLVAKEHPIWDALTEAGLPLEKMMMVEAVCNLEDGILIVGPQKVRFWVDRFHKWIERLDIERADVTKVELSRIGQKTRLVVRHTRGTARFQDIKAEIATQFEQAIGPKSPQPTSPSSAQLPMAKSQMSQDEKVGRVIDWIIDQPLPNGDKTLKKLQHRISRSRFRPAAELLISDVQSKGQGQIDLVEVLNLGSFLKLEWLVTLTAQEYNALLEADWSPPSEDLTPQKGRSIFGCLLLLGASAFVLFVVFGLLFI